jgi:hypothetical protein
MLYLGMTKAQIQTEIQKLLDTVPENVLHDVLNFLKELKDQPDKNFNLANNLRQILAEDRELLEKLAK